MGHAGTSAGDLPMPRARRAGAIPRDRAHGPRRLFRARLPRLVPGGHPGRPLRRSQRAGAQPAPRNHPRPGHELLLPQGSAGCGLLLRRAHPGRGADRVAAPHRRASATPGDARVRPGGVGVKVVILYDPGAEDWSPEDVRSVMNAVSEIAVIFDAMGHDVRRLGVRHDMRWLQICRSADLVFNLCEGVHGKSGWEEHVVGTLEFAGMPEGAWPILTHAAKWDRGSPEDVGSVPVCPANIPQRLAGALTKTAEAAWRVMQGTGYGRVDLRVDEQGQPWVLDVNPNPDLNDAAGLSRMAQAVGWDYAALVRRIAEVALREAQGAKAARELLAPSRRARAARTA